MQITFLAYRWRPLSSVANYVPGVFRWLRPVLVFLMMLRQCLHEKRDLVIPVTITSIDFQSSTLELAVFFIGVLLFFACLLSLVSMAHVLYTLKSQPVNRAQDVALGVEAFAIVCLMPYSIVHSVWLFVFVRQEWTSTFAKPVQVLHLVPTALVLLHTVTEGVL